MSDRSVNVASFVHGGIPLWASGIFGLGFSTSDNMLFWHQVTSSLGLPPLFGLALDHNLAGSNGVLRDDGELILASV